MALLTPNFLAGIITDNPLLVGATSIHDPSLTALPVVNSPDFMWLVLNPTLLTSDPHEVVKVTGHGSGANSATIIKGQDGTADQQWTSGTTWICGPTNATYAAFAALTGATMTGPLVVTHVVGSGASPTVANGAGIGNVPGTSVISPSATGNDASCLVKFTTGANPTPKGVLVTVTYATAFGSPPAGVTLREANDYAWQAGLFVPPAGIAAGSFTIAAHNPQPNMPYWVNCHTIA